MRIPFYVNPTTHKYENMPVHYLLFSQFRWYRRLIGGPWECLCISDSGARYWIRMKDVGSDYFESVDDALKWLELNPAPKP